MHVCAAGQASFFLLESLLSKMPNGAFKKQERPSGSRIEAVIRQTGRVAWADAV